MTDCASLQGLTDRYKEEDWTDQYSPTFPTPNNGVKTGTQDNQSKTILNTNKVRLVVRERGVDIVEDCRKNA